MGDESIAAIAALETVPATSIVLAKDFGDVDPGPEAPRENPVDHYLASLGNESSRKTARSSLKRALLVLDMPPEDWREMAWWTFKPQTGLRLRLRLQEKYGALTAKLTLSAVKRVLYRCWTLGYIDGDTFERVTSWGTVIGSSEELAGRMLTIPEIGRLRGACEKGGVFWGAMDAAIFAVGLGGGARRDELSRLRLGDVSDDCRWLSILGKRDKRRKVPLADWAAATVETWQAQRARFPFEHDRLFVRETPRKSAHSSMGLSKWQVWERMRIVGERVGIQFTPHDLRRTFISMLLDDHDLVTVQGMAGHGDPRTTARYDRRPMRLREKAAGTLQKLIGDAWAGR